MLAMVVLYGVVFSFGVLFQLRVQDLRYTSFPLDRGSCIVIVVFAYLRKLMPRIKSVKKLPLRKIKNYVFFPKIIFINFIDFFFFYVRIFILFINF